MGVSKPKKQTFRIGHLVSLVITILLLAGIRVTDYGQFTYYGYRPVIIVSGSMLPTVQINSLTFVKDCNMDDIEVGDIVMYYHPQLQINITHRAIDKYINEQGEIVLETKGDANPSSDGIEVTDEMVRGKMVGIFNSFAPFMSLMVTDQHLNKTVMMVAIAIIALAITSIISIISWCISMVYAGLWVSGIIKQNKELSNSLKIANAYRDLASNSHKLKYKHGDSWVSILNKMALFRKIISLAKSDKAVIEMYKEISDSRGKEV